MNDEEFEARLSLMEREAVLDATRTLQMANATIRRLRREIDALSVENRQLRHDARLGQEIETIVAVRTSFTGEPPYAGTAGLIRALTEALDERDELRAALRTLVDEVMRFGAAPAGEADPLRLYEAAMRARAALDADPG